MNTASFLNGLRKASRNPLVNGLKGKVGAVGRTVAIKVFTALPWAAPAQLRGFQKLSEIALGHYFFQALAAAVELDLFTVLSREPGLTRAEIAQRIKLEEKPTRVLLLCLGAVDLVRKKGDRYYNVPTGDMMSKDHPHNLSSIVRFSNHVTYRAMGHFEEALRTNTNAGLVELPGTSPTYYGRLQENPELWGMFREVSVAYGEMSAAMTASVLDLSRQRSLLEIGGAEGYNAIALAEHWPDLRITIIDLPDVVEGTRKLMEEKGLADRVTAIGLDAFTEEFPKGFDCVLLSNFISNWTEEIFTSLLQRVGRALVTGDKIFLVDGLQDNDEMGPPFMAHLCAYFFTLYGCGMIYTWAEYKGFLEAAGFASVSREPLPEPGKYLVTGTKT